MGKDTEKEKGGRFEGYCGHYGKWVRRQKDCWSRNGKPVNSVETDTAEPQDVDPPSEQGASGGTDTFLTSGLAG